MVVAAPHSHNLDTELLLHCSIPSFLCIHFRMVCSCSNGLQAQSVCVTTLKVNTRKCQINIFDDPLKLVTQLYIKSSYI